MQLLYLLLPQCCRTHSTPLCSPVTTKHLTLTLTLIRTLTLPRTLTLSRTLTRTLTLTLFRHVERLPPHDTCSHHALWRLGAVVRSGLRRLGLCRLGLGLGLYLCMATGLGLGLGLTSDLRMSYAARARYPYYLSARVRVNVRPSHGICSHSTL